MSMNLLSMSNEIKNINKKIQLLQTQNDSIINEIDKNFENIKNINNELENITNIFQITDDMKDQLKELEIKVTNLNNYNPSFKINKSKYDYNNVYNFLKKLNINDEFISKIMVLNCKNLNELLVIDEIMFDKLGIPKFIVENIKSKIESNLYNNMS